MKTLVLAAIAAATLATAGTAGGLVSGVPADNYVHRIGLWDEDAQKTVPMLVVRIDGKTTRYQEGQLGLTRDIIMGDHSLKAADWAKATFGRELSAVMYHDDAYGG